MTSKYSTQRYRSDTYPYNNNDIDYYSIETLDGWYSVTVDIYTDEFVLTTPFGTQVQDNLNHISIRKDLYHYDDGMIYEWLKLVKSKLIRARTEQGENNTRFKIGDRKYIMRMNKSTGIVKLTLPAHTRTFSAEDMYLEGNEDLPLVQKGQLDEVIRRKLNNKGFDLPRIPYKMGYKLTPKNQQD